MSVVAVDLFCGIGGLTKGLALSGVDVRAGVDVDLTCRFAYEANNDAVFLHEDVTKLSVAQLRKYYPDEAVKVLAGCAPCQPFSKYSKRYRKAGKKDGRWALLYAFSRLVQEASPEIVAMENVPGLRNEEVFKDFVLTLDNLGYSVFWKIAFCPDYGVPQKRNRLVLLASKLGKIDLVAPLCNEDVYPTVRQAIGGLPVIKHGERCSSDPLHQSSRLSTLNLERIRQSSPGGTWRDWDEPLQLECHRKQSGHSYPSVYGRMVWDEPSPTITTQFYGYGNGRFGHPEQDRAISLREGALLQSFPADYVFMDDSHPLNRRKLGVHIGNAVPVELGRAIGVSILRHLERAGEAIK